MTSYFDVLLNKREALLTHFTYFAVVVKTQYKYFAVQIILSAETGNDVNNQQDATAFSFINLFNSVLHVSGDKFVHPQEHFLTVYTAFGTMHRH